jgi:hypothetical protein
LYLGLGEGWERQQSLLHGHLDTKKAIFLEKGINNFEMHIEEHFEQSKMKAIFQGRNMFFRKTDFFLLLDVENILNI